MVMMKRLTCTYRIAFALLLLLAGTTLAQEGFLSDSSLAKFSVEDLVRIRKLLAKEREELLNEQDRIRERGVDVTK